MAYTTNEFIALIRASFNLLQSCTRLAGKSDLVLRRY